METFHNISWWTIPIDTWYPQSIVTTTDYAAKFPQRHPLSPTASIDRHVPQQSVMAANGYRQIFPLVYCHIAIGRYRVVLSTGVTCDTPLVYLIHEEHYSIFAYSPQGAYFLPNY